MIFVYLMIITIVALFSYKYIFGGKEGVDQRRYVHCKRKADLIWRKQFAVNMADIEEYWAENYPKSKRQNIVVKGALKQFEKAWVD